MDVHRTNSPRPTPSAGTPKERETFLEFREILTRAIGGLRDVRLRLEELAIEDERARLFVAALVQQRRALEEAIDRAVIEMPAAVSGSFVQYVVDPPTDTADGPPGLSPEQLAKWQSERDGAVSARLVDLTAKLRHPDAVEFVEAIVRLLLAHDRRVALELQSLRDL